MREKYSSYFKVRFCLEKNILGFFLSATSHAKVVDFRLSSGSSRLLSFQRHLDMSSPYRAQGGEGIKKVPKPASKLKEWSLNLVCIEPTIPIFEKDNYAADRM